MCLYHNITSDSSTSLKSVYVLLGEYHSLCTHLSQILLIILLWIMDTDLSVISQEQILCFQKPNEVVRQCRLKE